jgi:carbamoyl-phosphate synthase large subunit
METINTTDEIIVLVTGVGAIIGQGIIKSLRKSDKNIRIIGLDKNNQALGQYACDVFYTKPEGDETEPAYLSFWKSLLEKEKIDLVLPGLEVDVFFLNEHRQKLGGKGAVLGLNRSELIDLTRDKWQFGHELKKSGLEPIPTILTDSWSECVQKLGNPPFLLKPRQGNGSRGIIRLADMDDFEYWKKKSGADFMVQKIVGNDEEEFTVGAFGLGHGESLPPIIFRRKLSSAGNTQFAEVVEDSIIAEATNLLGRYFQPIGPTNYQFRKDHKKAYLLEINPRFSSSTSLRTGFGYNEADIAIDYFLYGKKPSVPVISRGQGWRYYEDFFIK